MQSWLPANNTTTVLKTLLIVDGDGEKTLEVFKKIVMTILLVAVLR